MKYYAREQDGVAAEIIKVKVGDDIAELYPAALIATLTEVSSSVKEGWVREGDGFVAPVAAPPSLERLLAYAADKRWRIEIGGMDFAGSRVATDQNSQTKVLGARIAAVADPSFETPWFGADGASVLLDAAALVALSNAMLAHVQGSFVIREAVNTQISAGTIASFAEIDAAFGA